MPKNKDKKSELAIARKGKVGKISIIGDIGWDYFGVSYKTFKQQLKDLGKVDMLEVEINSLGGIVTDGVAMLNALKESGVTVHTYINGVAASMGSVLAMAGDRLFVPDNSLMFVHKPLNMVIGNADDMRKMADDLDKFENAIVNSYQSHFKGSEDEMKTLMKEDTWLTADEVADKFNNVTVIATGEQEAAAHGEPLEILGDVVSHQETILDRAVNKVRNKVQNKPEEVEMTPEEIKEMKEGIVAETTTSVLDALKEAGVIKDADAEAKAKADAEAKAKADAEAKAKAGAEAKAKADAEASFEGDADDEEAVQAHLDALADKKLKDAVDWSDPESVAKYQKAKFGKKEPSTNASVQTTVLGKEEDGKFTAEAKEAAIKRMTNTK